ncbi:makorin, ring finger protein, 4 [Neosynchiropus ocellatus]
MDADQVPVCRHFLNGSCRFGDNCNYRHERPSAPATQVCRYFQKGGCWFGESCRWVVFHRIGDITCLVAAFSLQGIDMCSQLKERQLVQEEVQFQLGLHPQPLLQKWLCYKPRQRPKGNLHTEVSSREEGAAACTQSISPDTLLQSQDMTCGICMETVSEKLDPRHQMFGILPNCTHSFCLQCIMTWRKTKDLGTDVVKTCPQCRVRSPFYVPNKYWVEGAAKESLIVTFKKKFSRKSCSYYARYRCCPFKTECLYRHDKRVPHRTLQSSSDDEDEDFFDGIDLINFVMMSLFITDEDLDLSSFDSEDFA